MSTRCCVTGWQWGHEDSCRGLRCLPWFFINRGGTPAHALEIRILSESPAKLMITMLLMVLCQKISGARGQGHEVKGRRRVRYSHLGCRVLEIFRLSSFLLCQRRSSIEVPQRVNGFAMGIQASSNYMRYSLHS